ncbi:Grx4 family monothiol glutaredoxin [archaeon]|nr:MAG: Grx4 family monothiol glutaredoxin [archaeon]
MKDGLDDVVQMVGKQVKENPVMLYMKGTPQQPQCGFSLQAVRVLNAVGVDFSSVNVLEYPAIREAVKLYSDWPTIPQLYVGGEFVGGCDIVTNMYNDGSLEKLMKDKNLIKN